MTNAFPFIGLVTQNDEIPYLGSNSSFLRFMKNMRMDSSLDEIQRVFITLFGLIKMKRSTTFQGGEIKGKGNGLHLFIWKYSIVHL